MLVTVVYSKYFKRIRNVTFGVVLRWQDQKIRKMVASFLCKIINEGDLFFCFLLDFRFFSYEHFYVIYCKFWELDTDHDFLLDKENLIKYGNHALTYRIVDRIFSQV